MTTWNKQGNPDCICCNGAGPCAQVCATALGCNLLHVAGAAETLTQGTTVTGPCTTDATGRCCNPSTSGAYSVAVVASRFDNATVAGTATCPPPPSFVVYGPNYPGTLADDATIGSAAWSSPSNAGAADSVFATATSTGNAPTDYLKATDFGFALTNDGTEAVARVKLEVGVKGSAFANDYDVRMVVGGVIQSANVATGAGISIGSTGFLTYDLPVASWTSSLTPAQVNASGFGFVFSASAPGSGTTTGSASANVGTAANDASNGGTSAWSNPGNATGPPDGVLATVAELTSQETDFLKGTNTGISIPVTATPTQVTMTVGVKGSAGGVSKDRKAVLVFGGTPQAVNLAANTTLNTAGITTLTYVWNAGTGGLPTNAQVNSTGFGGAWSAFSTAFPALVASLDWMHLQVDYSLPGSTTISVDYIRATVKDSRMTYEVQAILTPASGYTCSQVPSCALPVAKTLTLTGPNGAVTLTWDSFNKNWSGSETYSGVLTQKNFPCAGPPTAGGTAKVTWRLKLSATINAALSFAIDSTFCNAQIQAIDTAIAPSYPPRGPGTAQFASQVGPIACPPSFLYSGTATDATGILPLSGSSITITE